ncbi:phosphoenolpyruvate hydrolase family protein [Bradyrhizobium sp. 190]|uniref:phosphoenolpyruvate hydrolase family protein n=1 Tax=Bradyrhizobium sp. 190 TaxID=2782658 RepID=UPI001FF85E45|nr:phosphoenolpyruvate hydrolase family protein [Bradyrhizobium sp. 190]
MWCSLGQVPGSLRRSYQTGVSRRRRETRDDIIIPYQAGPNANPEDARFILGASPGGHGIYGTSSLDRVPTEEAIESQAVALKTIRCQTA